MSVCVADRNCPMTAGYYLGGGQWMCWLHAIFNRDVLRAIAKTGQTMKALPKETDEEKTAAENQSRIPASSCSTHPSGTSVSA